MSAFFSAYISAYVLVAVLTLSALCTCTSAMVGDDKKGETKNSTITFFNSWTKADADVAGFNRSINKILVSQKNTSQSEKKRILKELIELQEKLNREYSGQPVKWNTVLVKSLLKTEKRVDVIVPSWVVGATGRLLTMSGDNTVSKHFVVTIPAIGLEKELNKGEKAFVNATVKEVAVNLNGATVSFNGWSCTKE